MAGMKLQAITSNRAKCEIAIGGETFDVTYRPAAYTPAALSRAQETLNDERIGEFYVDFVMQLVEEWEIFDGDDRLPVTREVIENIPIDVLGAIIEGVQEDMGKAESASGGG